MRHNTIETLGTILTIIACAALFWLAWAIL